MAKDLCANGALDNAKYSSPMPVIGLYITGATLVCFSSMVCDILYGFRSRKPWLPCRFFSLNSLTLTLLSIATKLPVDLTTAMPSSQDQLSKLTGTTLICISMGFFMPSLGIMSDKDGLSNMASLTILVVAVVVNVCIQMATGVIFSFIVEHVIILFCMLVLLAILWSSVSTSNFQKTICADRTKELLLKGETQGQSSMMERLKLCYVHSYSSNPQMILFQAKYCVTIGMLCTLCLVVLLEAVFRSFGGKELKFCEQVSDYGWSMKIVVVTQILAVLVGSVATSFRWLTFVSRMKWMIFSEEADAMLVRPLVYELQIMILKCWAIKLSKMSFMKIFRLLEFLVGLVVFLMQLGFYVMSQLVLWSSFKVREIFGWAMRNTKNCYCSFLYKDRDDETRNSITPEFRDVIYSVEEGLEEWMLRTSVEDMERWMGVNKKRDYPNNLIELLLKTPPSLHSLANDIQRAGQAYRPSEHIKELYGYYNYRVSCHSIVVLVLVAAISVPSTLSGSLIRTLDEVFEIIYFIDRKMNVVSFGNELTWMLAKDVWMYRDNIIHWFQKEILGNSNGVSQPQIDLDLALGIITKLRKYTFAFSDAEVTIITDFLTNRDNHYNSVIELYNHIKQLFVDILHSYLINLPSAILKDVNESPAEECEERVRHAMKFLCKLELLDAKVQWLFPNGTNISSLLTTLAPTTETTYHNTQMESVALRVNALRVNEYNGDNVFTTHDEIIQEIT